VSQKSGYLIAIISLLLKVSLKAITSAGRYQSIVVPIRLYVDPVQLLVHFLAECWPNPLGQLA
jgi:hypothetical protein